MKKEENNFASKIKEMMHFRSIGMRLFSAFFALVLAAAMSFSAIAQVPDPGHGASQVGPGTFAPGNFTFPENLDINKHLWANGSINITGDTWWGISYPIIQLG